MFQGPNSALSCQLKVELVLQIEIEFSFNIATPYLAKN